MQISLECEVFGLHKADARYHENCHQPFTSVRNIKAALRKSAVTDNEQDKGMEKFISNSFLKKNWSSIELQTLYQENNRTDCNQHQLVDKLKEVNCHHNVN